jgi:hypothetical protein
LCVLPLTFLKSVYIFLKAKHMPEILVLIYNHVDIREHTKMFVNDTIYVHLRTENKRKIIIVEMNPLTFQDCDGDRLGMYIKKGRNRNSALF